jgi:hypothetical protein
MHEVKVANKKERITNEFLFVMYFWGFTLLHPVLSYFNSISTIILFGYAFAILAVSIVKTLKLKMPIEGSYFIIYGMFLVFLLDCLFRINAFTLDYMYGFVIYGVIPIYLFTQVKCAEKMLRIYSLVSLLAFLMYFSDPFRGYPIFGDYMSFGFSIALPAYFGLHIGRKYFHMKLVFIPEILCLAETVVFANRSVLLSIIIFWIVLGLFYSEKGIKKDAKIITGMVLGFVVIVKLRDILTWAVKEVSDRGFSSYSLIQIQTFIQYGDWSKLFSGRLEIWERAKNSINDNFILGSGTASFEAEFGSYTHNMYYDIMTQYGLLGLTVVAVLIVNSLFRIHKHKGYTKLLGIFLFCLWFPKLFFSTYFFRDIGFWCFLAFGFLNFEIRKTTNTNELEDTRNCMNLRKTTIVKNG